MCGGSGERLYLEGFFHGFNEGKAYLDGAQASGARVGKAHLGKAQVGEALVRAEADHQVLVLLFLCLMSNRFALSYSLSSTEIETSLAEFLFFPIDWVSYVMPASCRMAAKSSTLGWLSKVQRILNTVSPSDTLHRIGTKGR